MDREKALNTVTEIFNLYEKWGRADYVGEPVSQSEHMLQAAQLAEKEGCPMEVVLAAFFHDIGHLCQFVMPVSQMEGVGVMDHEKIGAEYLRSKGFSEQICRMVESHVQTKRYLTFKNPSYYETLSEASRATLKFQGGVMTAEEAQQFEADPLHGIYIKLRQWDDLAKERRAKTGSLEKYKGMALEHLGYQ